MKTTTSVTDRKIFGKLGSVGLHDIIQLLTMSKRTVTVRLRSGARRGRLYFRDGQIVHAEGGGFEGEDSIIELLSWSGPEFTIEEGIDSLPKTTITTRTDALLLGTLTRLDETARERVPPIRPSRTEIAAPRKRPLPRRPRGRPRPRFDDRKARVLGWLGALACVPVLWLATAPRLESTLVWLAPWNDLPPVDSGPPAAPAPLPLPDAVAVASAVDSEPIVVPEPSRAPASVPPGYLTVVVEPWARVAIDGVPKGETPLAKMELDAGSHELVLDNDHAAGLIRDVIEIAPGRVILKRYSFHDVGYVRVVVTPWADVSVDGRLVGQTPMGPIPVVAGTHSIRFTHPDLGDVQRTVEVGSGETTFVRMALTN